ncbi:MAG: hypothetical protein M0Z95_13815 [Actinomycetota bacterium]|nr:hypothetical protein [Actinomycetota bacterium]
MALVSAMLAGALFADAMAVLDGGLEWLWVLLVQVAIIAPPALRYRSMLVHERSAAEAESA